MDGLRLVSGQRHELIRRLPGALAEVLRPGSTAPSAQVSGDPEDAQVPPVPAMISFLVFQFSSQYSRAPEFDPFALIRHHRCSFGRRATCTSSAAPAPTVSYAAYPLESSAALYRLARRPQVRSEARRDPVFIPAAGFFKSYF